MIETERQIRKSERTRQPRGQRGLPDTTTCNAGCNHKPCRPQVRFPLWNEGADVRTQRTNQGYRAQRLREKCATKHQAKHQNSDVETKTPRIQTHRSNHCAADNLANCGSASRCARTNCRAHDHGLSTLSIFVARRWLGASLTSARGPFGRLSLAARAPRGTLVSNDPRIRIIKSWDRLAFPFSGRRP